MCGMHGFCTRLWLTSAVVLALPLVSCKKTIQARPESLGGVGVVLQTTPTGPEIAELVAGGPAASAGIHVGDRVLAVNGESVDGKSLATVVASLRGKNGSSVVVRVRGGTGDLTVTLLRQQLSRTSTGYTVN
jgi:C-terminal processing protease CtpA/Prc